MSIQTQISDDLAKLLNGNLIDHALTISDLNEVALQIESIIMMRTADGEFLNAGAERSYLSAGHKKKREKGGLQINHVDLFFSGDMLAGMRSRAILDKSEATVEYGFIDSESPVRAMELAGYHNETGAGKTHIVREFVGLTDDEIDRVFTVFEDRILGNLSD